MLQLEFQNLQFVDLSFETDSIEVLFFGSLCGCIDFTFFAPCMALHACKEAVGAVGGVWAEGRSVFASLRRLAFVGCRRGGPAASFVGVLLACQPDG